jgi:adenylosuccinate lyase
MLEILEKNSLEISTMQDFKFTGSLKNKVGTEAQYKELIDAVKKFEAELTIHENNIHQTKNRGRQGFGSVLVYTQLAGLSTSICEVIYSGPVFRGG